MEVHAQAVKAAWAKPTLAQKRLEETRAQLGAVHDNLSDDES